MMAGMDSATSTGLSKNARAIADRPIRTPMTMPTTIGRATPMPKR